MRVIAQADRAGHHRFRAEIRSGDTVLVAEEATHYMSPEGERVSRRSSNGSVDNLDADSLFKKSHERRWLRNKLSCPMMDWAAFSMPIGFGEAACANRLQESINSSGWFSFTSATRIASSPARILRNAFAHNLSSPAFK